MAPPPAASLEDRAFGPSGNSGAPAGTLSDAAAAYMFPLAVTLSLMAVVAYSICKGIEYQELFQTSPRCRNGLLLANACAVGVAAALVARSVHEEARKRCAG